jgi:hypothetical protein
METIHIQGIEKLQAKLAQAGPRALGICGAALTECGEEIMTESKRQVPVLTGALKNSGRVFGAWGGQTQYGGSALGTLTGAAAASIQGMGGENGVTVTLAYGGAALEYAKYVHEIPGRHHPNGKDHFLSDPAKGYGLGSKLAAKLHGRLERALAH